MCAAPGVQPSTPTQPQGPKGNGKGDKVKDGKGGKGKGNQHRKVNQPTPAAAAQRQSAGVQEKPNAIQVPC